MSNSDKVDLQSTNNNSPVEILHLNLVNCRPHMVNWIENPFYISFDITNVEQRWMGDERTYQQKN